MTSAVCLPKPSTQNAVVATAEPPSKVTARLATPEELTLIANRIWATVEESAVPISGGLLASRMRDEHPRSRPRDHSNPIAAQRERTHWYPKVAKRQALGEADQAPSGAHR